MVTAIAPPARPPKHIFMCTFPFGTHVNSLHALARALAAAAPEVIFSFAGTAEKLASLPQMANVRLIPYEDATPDGRSAAGVLERIERFLAEAPEKIRAAVKTAAAEDKGGVPVTCLVTDSFMWMAEPVAEELRVPWVALFSGFPLGLLAHLHTDDLRTRFGTEKEAIPSHADKLIDFIPGLEKMRVRDLPDGIIHGDINSNFSRHLHGLGQRLPRAAAVVLVTLPVFEQVSTLFTELNQPHPIGPLNLLSPLPSITDKEVCLPWLDSHATSSVVYVAFGSVFTLPPSELAELARGLEDSGVPFLWSLKQDARSGLPKGFVERTRLRGRIVNWAPQLSVLNHAAVGVFMTHCGWKSVLESISAGVVMLCRPILADQMMVGRALENMWGVGLHFDEGITRNKLVAAMDAVLKGDEGKRMRERVSELREKTRQAMLPGGSLSKNFKDLVEFVSHS